MGETPSTFLPASPSVMRRRVSVAPLQTGDHQSPSRPASLFVTIQTSQNSSTDSEEYTEIIYYLVSLVYIKPKNSMSLAQQQFSSTGLMPFRPLLAADEPVSIGFKSCSFSSILIQ